ncbi:MAG: hypothetical protein WAN92_07105 [Herbaspirillum sp.]
MQDAMAIFTRQPINYSTLMGRHGNFINKTPVPLVEVKRFLSGDRIMGITVPCDQPELGELSNDKGVGCGFHESIMPHVHGVFKQRVRAWIKSYNACMAILFGWQLPWSPDVDFLATVL